MHSKVQGSGSGRITIQGWMDRDTNTGAIHSCSHWGRDECWGFWQWCVNPYTYKYFRSSHDYPNLTCWESPTWWFRHSAPLLLSSLSSYCKWSCSTWDWHWHPTWHQSCQYHWTQSPHPNTPSTWKNSHHLSSPCTTTPWDHWYCCFVTQAKTTTFSYKSPALGTICISSWLWTSWTLYQAQLQ